MSQEPRLPIPEDFSRAARLGPTAVIEGEIKSAEDLLIEGRVKGKIEVSGRDLLVAENGRVEAEIRARNISIRGEVSGNVTATEKITIEKSGRVKGDLTAPVISIEDGARFQGSVKVLKKE